MIRAAAIRMKNHARNCASVSGSKTSIDLSLLRVGLNDDWVLNDYELIGRSNASRVLSHPSINKDRIARLSGYFEALRSKMEDYVPAVEAAKERELQETCNLVDLICLNAVSARSSHWMGSSDNTDLILCIMRGLICNLWGLHYSGVIHGNLKPHNVLVFEGDCMLTSIIEDGSDPFEWKAPEQILYKTQTKASDMFSFGCVLYFCITRGCHPFGDIPSERVQNIIANKTNISRIEDVADAYHLISRLLSPEPKLRPKAHEVIWHPFLEDLRTKIEFIYDLYVSMPLVIDEISEELISKAPVFGNLDWHSRFAAYARAHGSSTKQPFEEFKKVFGPRGSSTFFPKIFMSAYEVTYKHNRGFTGIKEVREGQFPVFQGLRYRYYC